MDLRRHLCLMFDKQKFASMVECNDGSRVKRLATERLRLIEDIEIV